MDFTKDEYDADDLLIQIIASELLVECELSLDLHPALCRWVVDTLNSCDPRNDMARLLLASKLSKAFSLLSGEFH
jgi:hypothetical protein